jgi:hypothetical protein
MTSALTFTLMRIQPDKTKTNSDISSDDVAVWSKKPAVASEKVKEQLAASVEAIGAKYGSRRLSFHVIL